MTVVLIALGVVVWLLVAFMLAVAFGRSAKERPRRSSSNRVPPRTTGR